MVLYLSLTVGAVAQPPERTPCAADATPTTIHLRLRGRDAPLPGMQLVVDEQLRRADVDGAIVACLPPGAAEPTLRPLDPRFRLVGQLERGPAGRVTAWFVEDEGWELVARYSRATDRPGTQVITGEEIRLAPGTLNDPIRAVSTRPGLARSPFESGWLLVRGGDPGDTNLSYDGVRIPLIYHLGGFASVLPPQLVREVRFWPGAHPARFGRSIAGAVDVVPAPPPAEPVARLGANVAFAHASVESPTPIGGLTVAVRRSYLDAAMRAFLTPEQARIAPRFWDVSARLDGGANSISFVALSDAIDAPTGIGDETVEVRQSAAQLQAHLRAQLGEAQLHFTPWLSSWSRALTGDSEPWRTRELFPGARLELRGGQRVRWDVGLEGEWRHFRVEQGTSRRQRPGLSTDPYVDVRLGDVVQLDLGYRLETLFLAEQLPRAGHAPRAALRWRPSSSVQLHAGAFRGFQLPQPVLMIGLADGAYLPLERAEGAEIGGRFVHGALQVDLTGWARWLAELAALEDDGSLAGLQGRAAGVELQALWRTEALTVRAIYQLTWSRRWENADLVRFAPPWDQPHRVQLSALWQLPRGWGLALRGRYSAATPAPRRPTDAYDLLTGQIEPLTPTLGRLSPFVGLDAKLSKRFTLKRYSVDAYLDLQNLTNTRIYEPVITGLDDRHPAYSRGLPILPVLGIEAVVPLRRVPPGA